MSSAHDDVPGAIVVAARLEEVRVLAEWLKARCAEAGLADMDVFDLELAMVEAANNCVEHGYEADGTGSIGLDLEIRDGTVVVRLADRGRPIPGHMFQQCREVAIDAESGRGIAIVQSCVDELDYASKDGLNMLELRKRLA